MNFALCSLFATSLLVAYITPSKANNVIDEDYDHVNKIDYIAIEPSKNVNMMTNITIKVSFSESIKYVSTLKLTLLNSKNFRGVLLQTFSLKDVETTIHYQYNSQYSAITRRDTFKFVLSGQGNDDVTVVTKQYEPNTMYIQNENETYESSDNISIYRRGEGTTYHKEKFIFSNLKKEYYLESFNGIDISNLFFTYDVPNGIDLNFTNARLIIEGREDSFIKMSTQLSLPTYHKCDAVVEKVDNNKRYQIRVNNELYVNPVTFEMSDKAINGYVKTNYLYFPRPKEDLETYLVRFMVDDMGVNYYDFSYQFKVYVTSNSFGFCADLRSEDAYPDLSMGTIISQ